MRIQLVSGWTELCVVLSNLSRELLWCFPGSTHNLSSSICLLGWCVLYELVLNCVCQYLSNENPANVCLDCALCSHCLSGELSRCLPLSVSQCLPLICLGSYFGVFLDQPSVYLLGLIGVLAELALSCLLASVQGENPANICLDWIHLSCQSLSEWIQSMSAKGFSDVFC